MEGHKARQPQDAPQMAGRSAQGGHRGSQPPEKIERAQRDMADLQRLIRYVERWRMAHFQRPDEVRAGMGEGMAGDPTAARGRSRRRVGDRRLSDADELLQKLRSGLQTAAGEAMAGSQDRTTFQLGF